MLAGLSYEKHQIAGDIFNAGNIGLVGCFARLGSSVLRLGGNSVDATAWAVNGPGSVLGQVAPADISALAAFLASSGWRIIYGINFATNTPAAAAQEAAYASKVFGNSLYGFEIGNEPDLYPINGLRPSTYTASDFVSEWQTFAAAILEAVPGAPLTGPASDGQTWISQFVSSESAQLQLVTEHYYRGDASAAISTMSYLLDPDPKLVTELKGLKSASAGISLGYRIGECNSYFNTGLAGVSNAFGSGLWAIDFMMLNAQYGSGGVNFHGGGDDPGGYTPIADNHGAPFDVRPEYYGMLLVAQIAPGPMYVVNVSAEISMTAYAVAGNDGATYLVIINKDPSTSVIVNIALGAYAIGANLLTFAGDGLNALSGQTLGGASIAPNGTWAPNSWPGVAINGSALNLPVSAASAVLLKIV